MLIRVFWAYVLGFLVLTVRGEHPERFLNLATMRGVALWDVLWVNPETILVKVAARSFRPLRHIARRTKVRVRIRTKHGLPFILQRLRRRWMLVGGAITFCLLLYLLSSLIWTVDVSGTRQLDPAPGPPGGRLRRAVSGKPALPGQRQGCGRPPDAGNAGDRLCRGRLPGDTGEHQDLREGLAAALVGHGPYCGQQGRDGQRPAGTGRLAPGQGWGCGPCRPDPDLGDHCPAAPAKNSRRSAASVSPL